MGQAGIQRRHGPAPRHLGEYRFSEDLDFTLLNEDDFDTVTRAFSEVAASVTEETGMAFAYQRPDRNPHENSHTFYMTFTGPMGRAREFKVDVTPLLKSFRSAAETPRASPLLSTRRRRHWKGHGAPGLTHRCPRRRSSRGFSERSGPH
jgi:hypothetical protein